MIAAYATDESSVFTVELQPEAGDRNELPNGARLQRNRAAFWMPRLWDDQFVHPDLLALTVLLCCAPFIGGRLQLPRGVSQRLADVVHEYLNIEIAPVDNTLPPRLVDGQGVPGLSFSGGVDSTAALEVMPSETVSVFLDRLTSENAGKPSLYRADAARAACVSLRERGRRIVMVSTDLEHLRAPVGFPTDLSAAAPLVLLSDFLALDSVSWGTIAESAYRVGHLKFTEYYERRTFANWAAVFEAVGLPVLNPLAGVSEVGSSRIVLERGWRKVAQSCIRGSVEAPCMNCWKCFRKSLLDAALSDNWPTRAQMDELFRIPEAQRHLANVPIKHENVVAYIVSRYEGDHPEMAALKRRILLIGADVDYLRHWYAPSSHPWPEKYRASVVKALDEVLGRMSDLDEGRFRAWDVSKLNSKRSAQFAQAYGEMLASTNPLRRVRVENYNSPNGAPVTLKKSASRLQASDLEREVAKLHSELEEVKRSASYRVGRFLELSTQ